MNIKNIANSILIFTINRLIEIFGIVIFVIGLILFIALISYSPSDPNFIFPDNTTIKNLLGFQGSYTSDLFFQSVGLISFLIPVSLINWPISSASEGLIVAERITVLPFTIFFARPFSSKMIDFA